MHNKLATIKHCPKLSAIFSIILATLAAFNLLFVLLFSGPLAGHSINNLVIALGVTVLECIAIVALLRSIPVTEGEISEKPLEA